ncbi:putative mitochondrial protein [Tanacetum coccineum]
MVNTRNNAMMLVITMESLQEIANDLKASIAKITEGMKGFLVLQKLVTDEIHKLKRGEGTSSNNGGSHGDFAHRPVNLGYDRMTKIEFPKFSGEDVKGWLFRCKKFFKIYGVDDRDKIELASMHMYDKALVWHQQFCKRFGENSSWEVDETEVLKRFDVVFEYPMMELKNLRQEGNVQNYQEQFEALLNKVEVGETHAISLFLGGIKKETNMTIRMFSLVFLNDVYYLAKMQEQTLIAVKSRYAPILPTHTTKLHVTSSFVSRNNNYAGRNVYVPGHKCSGQLHSLEVISCEECDCVEESLDEQCLEDEIMQSEEGEMVATTENCPHISLNALNGIHSFQTMRVRGQVRRQTLQILIDYGSTHNFLDLQKAKKMGCRLTSMCPLQVEVANGNNMVSTYKCKNFKWTLQGVPYETEGKRISRRGVTPAALKWIQGSAKATLSSMMVCVYPVELCTLTTKELDEKSLKNKEISAVIKEFDDVFVVPKSLPPQRSHDHQFPLQNGTPRINIRPYKHPRSQKDAIESMVKELHYFGVIRTSQSPFSSLIVMVKNKDGSWRMCVDYRLFNKYTMKDKFTIPMIEELIDELHRAKMFSKLDLTSGYHHIRMKESDIYKTAFRTHEGHYEFLLMRTHALFAKLSKCNFAVTHVEYLGHIISAPGVSTDPVKITTMKDWPMPKNIKQLRGFLGLTRYYRRFIRYYALISKPLTLLLKKQGFVWNEEVECAFYKLKKAMMQAPVLALPNFEKEFIIETDASGTGVGAVLQQDGHHISYMSKSLSTKHHALSTYEKEFLVVLLALDKWRGYVLDMHFTIKTDHLSLKYLLDQRFTTPFQTKWLPKLLGYDYQIMYKKGNEKGAADALSRVQMDNGEFSAMGILVTTKKMSVVLYWKGMRRMVKQWVKECDICQKHNPDLSLHASNGKTTIFVVVDRLSKYAHFIPLHHPFTAAQVAQAFMDNVYKLHGLPETINFGTTLISTLPYLLLRLRWCMAKHPPIHIPYLARDSSVESVDTTLQAREEVIKMLKIHMKRAHDRMKSQANKHRSDRSFEVGSWVYLKLQPPHRQVTARQGPYHKLSAKFYGPFMIEEKIGAVAYKLKLPNGSQIHLVFHVSQLKQCKGMCKQLVVYPI